MKIIYTITLCFLVISAAFTQKIVNKTLSLKEGQKIELDLKFGDNIIIKAWDKKEVGFSASVKVNNNKLNDALIISFTEKDNLRIASDFDDTMLKNAKSEDCPGSSNNSFFDGTRICSEIKYEIYLPKNADVEVETINANIEIIDHEGPMYAKSISGFIDVTRGSDKGVDLTLKTITGEFFSDLNIAFEGSEREFSPGGQRISGEVNGGGIPLYLETISSNIYLRSQQAAKLDKKQ